MKFDCMYLFVFDGLLVEDDFIWNFLFIKVVNGYDDIVGL